MRATEPFENSFGLDVTTHTLDALRPSSDGDVESPCTLSGNAKSTSERNRFVDVGRSIGEEDEKRRDRVAWAIELLSEARPPKL
jgi:hypothetical protein